MTTDEPRLKHLADVLLNDEPSSPAHRLVVECEFVEVHDQLRLYYQPIEEAGSGFYFKAVQWCGGPSFSAGETPPETWDPRCEVEVVVHGYGFFDGIRHQWWGEDGYLYYFGGGELGKLAMALAALEARFCDDLR